MALYKLELRSSEEKETVEHRRRTQESGALTLTKLKGVTGPLVILFVFFHLKKLNTHREPRKNSLQSAVESDRVKEIKLPYSSVI